MAKPPAVSTTGSEADSISVPFPKAAGGLPLLGHLVPMLRNPLKFLAGLPPQGDVVQVRLGPLRALVVCEPALTSHVLRNDKIFDKGGPIFDLGRKVVGDALLTCPHSGHRRQRRMLQPAFLAPRLPGYAEATTARAADATASWRDGQILDVLAETQALTAKITLDTMFSATAPPQVLTEALSDLNTIIKALSVQMATPPLLARLPTPGNRRYQQAWVRLRRNLRHLVTDRRAAGIDHGDLLSMLLTAHDAESGPAQQTLTDTEIIDQIVTFFLGATETSASSLASALHMLGQHPEIERRLHAEVDAVLDGRPATHADLPRLELTGRVVTETLRLWPPIWGATRVCTADTQLGRHPVPAGTTILYSPYLIQRRADLYPDPERFDPDRWTANAPQPPRREAFLPFGGGARKCIGDRFATASATLALATITNRWRLQPLPDLRVRPSIDGPALTPRGLKLRATTRTTTPAGPLPPQGEEKPSNPSEQRLCPEPER
ncbi:cytochrome P450 [Streptomyces sp. NPDC059989]|uniref:cytochrome P450 n=1 Tax=Streptomyces sp. NPDC059989 TaxID=3347026 RepID=UPI0036C839B3